MGAVPVITVTGWSNSGKTTFVTRVVGLLTDMGVRVGVIKHHGHKTGGVDVGGQGLVEVRASRRESGRAQRFGPVRYLCEHAAGRADAR